MVRAFFGQIDAHVNDRSGAHLNLGDVHRRDQGMGIRNRRFRKVELRPADFDQKPISGAGGPHAVAGRGNVADLECDSVRGGLDIHPGYDHRQGDGGLLAFHRGNHLAFFGFPKLEGEKEDSRQHQDDQYALE